LSIPPFKHSEYPARYQIFKGATMKKTIITVLIIQIITLWLSSPYVLAKKSASDSYELTPFNLIKKKPAKAQETDDLEDFEVVGTENVQGESSATYQLMLQSSYFFMIGFLKDRNDFYLPYTTLAIKRNYLELEAGYMGMRGGDSILPMEDTSHSLPFFISIAPEISISQSFSITPKLGIGGIAIMTHANYSPTRYSFLVAAKGTLDISFYVSQNLHIAVQNSFILGQDLQEPFFSNMHFYYSPGLALNYKF